MSKPKLIEQIENAGGVFVATYGTTTYQEIKDAYDGGKDVIIPYNGTIFELITIPTGKNYLTFHRRDFSSNNFANTVYDSMVLDSDGTWGPITTMDSGNISTPIQRNSSTYISSSTGYYRPIRISTSEPTASDGNIGDIWIQYDAD